MKRPTAQDDPQASGFGRALRSKAPIAWFGLKFCVLMALYYGLVLLPLFDRMLYAYLGANAWAANAILNLLGTDSQVSQVTVRSAGFVMNVRRGCDAIEPAWFFCSAVIAFPGPWSAKVPGILAGSAIILAMNLARLVSLFLIGLHYPRIFAVAHLEIWPAAFIILAVLLLVAWIGWARRIPGIDANAAT
jgi:exosortase/archaeosortase family protein